MSAHGSLAKKLESRDKSAQMELIHRFNARIFLYFKTRLKGEGNCEDLVQEVYSAFFAGVGKHKIQEDRCIAPFIFGIARRVLCNYFYRKKKEAHIDECAREYLQVCCNFTEHQRLENKKITLAIERIIATLPPIDRFILEEFYLKENKIPFISALLGKTRHYVSVRKERALKKIKSEIIKQDDIYI